MEDESELKAFEEKCKFYQTPYSIFKEPDIDNQLTAVAFISENKKLTQKLKLL